MTIEYSPEILQNQPGTGVLFGVRQKTRIHILAARPGLGDRDPLLVGLDPVGIYSARPRGEVFFTEADLERFEEFRVLNAVALVVAGGKAGFFVRESGGAIQSIQSYEEFSAVDDVQNESIPRSPLGPVWLWFAVGALALFTTFVILRPYLPVHTPLALQVRADEGQLRITWNPERGNLEIVDGVRSSRIPISDNLAGVTYVPSTGDVEVRLSVRDQRAIARFVGPEPPVLIQNDPVREQIVSMEAEAASLRQNLQNRRIRADGLRSQIRKRTTLER